MPVDSFKIVEVRDTLMLDAAMQPVEALRVHFTWGLGRRGWVDIPKALAPTAAALMEIAQGRIDDEIERQEALWSLGAG